MSFWRTCLNVPLRRFVPDEEGADYILAEERSFVHSRTALRDRSKEIRAGKLSIFRSDVAG